MEKPRLILASGSPRRQELLNEAGYTFDVLVPSEGAECGICTGEGPAAMVSRLAYQKARDVAARINAGILVSCDTVAECRGLILGKPAHRQHAHEMLQWLSGREHRVYSGLCVWPFPEKEPNVRVAVTTLYMDRISDDQLEQYLDTDQWEGKAGAFGYQDRLGWVRILQGSETNVVGLPMELLAEMLPSPGDGEPMPSL